MLFQKLHFKLLKVFLNLVEKIVILQHARYQRSGGGFDISLILIFAAS